MPVRKVNNRYVAHFDNLDQFFRDLTAKQKGPSDS
jgi:hypothetical protein